MKGKKIKSYVARRKKKDNDVPRSFVNHVCKTLRA
jgi:hypothetical protein